MTKPIAAGRQVLCLEDPKTRVTSRCAKTLDASIKAAQRGLNTTQKKLWKTFVFQPAVQKVERFCKSRDYVIIPGAEEGSPPSPRTLFKTCVMNVLAGRWKFEGLRKQKHIWVRYLNGGAKQIKKLTTKAPAGGRVRNRAAE
jgi:hypothetical protein